MGIDWESLSGGGGFGDGVMRCGFGKAGMGEREPKGLRGVSYW